MDRATTRDEYEIRRMGERSRAIRRVDRSLPHHPDGSGIARCPRCEMYGCALCEGTGYLDDGHRDPLLRLRHARQRWMRRRDPARYQVLRQICAVPCWQLRLIEAAVGCELAARRAVAAWKSAA